MGTQKILEEQLDSNYEPTPTEIKEYAEWLGIDIELEQDLLWIARQGLTAELPEQWKPCQNEVGQLYYFNFDTGESVWEHPCDKDSKQLCEQERANANLLARPDTLGNSPMPDELVRQTASTFGDSVPGFKQVDTHYDAPPDLGQQECVFVHLDPVDELLPEQGNNVSRTRQDLWPARCTHEDAADCLEKSCTVEVAEEHRPDAILQGVQCTQTAKQTLHDQTARSGGGGNTNMLEHTIQKAVWQLKAELELKQTEAFLELKRSLDKKCSELQLNHSLELQQLKAQMSAEYTYRNQSDVFQGSLEASTVASAYTHGEASAPTQVSTSQSEPNDFVKQPQALARSVVAGQEPLGTGADSDTNEQQTNYDEWQRDQDSAGSSAVHQQESLQQHSRRPRLAAQQCEIDTMRKVETLTGQALSTVQNSLVQAESKIGKATPPFPGVPEASEVLDEHSFRKQALAFFKEQKKMLRRRQDAMHKAREEWSRNAEMLACVQPSIARDDMVAMLKQVHHTLETQAQRLNDDATQLSLAKDRMGIARWRSGSTGSETVVMEPEKIPHSNHISVPAGGALQKLEHRRGISTMRDISNHAEAEHILHSHAKWLRSLREQIVKVSQTSDSRRDSQQRGHQ